MLVAYRLACLSALDAHYADLNALAQFGPTQDMAAMAEQRSTNSGRRRNACQGSLGETGTGRISPDPAVLGITHRPSSPSRFFRPTPT